MRGRTGGDDGNGRDGADLGGGAGTHGRAADLAPHPVTASITLGVAVGVFGVSFGVLAVASGLSVGQACAMSLLVFTGASQFAAVSVVGAGGSTAAALGSALLLAARNGAYAIAVSDLLPRRLPSRLVAAQLVIDESTAMAAAQPDPADGRRAFWVTGLAVFVCWNVGTLVGALGGDQVGDPGRFGLDAAFPAGFVALLAPHIRSVDGKVAAAIGAALALVVVPIVPVGAPILLAALACLVGLRSLPNPDPDPNRGSDADPGGAPGATAPGAT